MSKRTSVEPSAEPLEWTVHLREHRKLEGGGAVRSAPADVWCWGTRTEHRQLEESGRLHAHRRTTLVLPTLTSGPRVAGKGGFWDELVGKGRLLRPWAQRLVSVSLLGSASTHRFERPARRPPFPAIARGDLRRNVNAWPVAVTPWDQAAYVLDVLDALGIGELDLVIGASLGGMVAQCVAMLAPERVGAVVSVAAPIASTAWMIGHNHLMREALATPSGGLSSSRRALSIARQIGRLVYRAPSGLAASQGRRIAGPAHRVGEAWRVDAPYRIETYLRFHGDAFAETHHPATFVRLLGAMDHHDLARQPAFARIPDRDWSLTRIRARFLMVASRTDQLVFPQDVERSSDVLREAGVSVNTASIDSEYGHDAFLVETAQLGRIIGRWLRHEDPTQVAVP